jgi:two-component system CheB/CheR fusion protein
MVIFAPHNILSDPPFTKLDFLSCRNLLISLDTALQKRLLPVLHYTLRPHGFLFLGTSETVRERLAEPLPMGTERILFVDDEEA